MTTAELIEKLERADGPSRELDEAIYELMGGCNHKRTKYYAVQSDTGFTCLDCGKDTYGAKYAPNYTASIDAAMTLYIHKPDVVSSCPRKVCVNALQQRIEVLGKGSERGE